MARARDRETEVGLRGPGNAHREGKEREVERVSAKLNEGEARKEERKTGRKRKSKTRERERESRGWNKVGEREKRSTGKCESDTERHGYI